MTDTLCPVFRGVVVTQECVDKLIKKDMIDPVSGAKLSEKDIIPLQRVRVFTGGGRKSIAMNFLSCTLD